MDRPAGQRVKSGARRELGAAGNCTTGVTESGARPIGRATVSERRPPRSASPLRENLTRFPVDFRSRDPLRARPLTAGFSAFDSGGAAGDDRVAGSMHRRPARTSRGPDRSERTVARPNSGDGAIRIGRLGWTESGRERRTDHS